MLITIYVISITADHIGYIVMLETDIRNINDKEQIN